MRNGTLSSQDPQIIPCRPWFIHPATATRKNRHGVRVIRPGIVPASGKLRKSGLTESGRTVPPTPLLRERVRSPTGYTLV